MRPVSSYCIRRRASVILFPALVLTISLAHAILFYSTGDTNYNSTAPSGALTNSGWQYEGFWGSFLGTPIDPKYFITAKHVGGQVGDPFVFRGVVYPTTAVHDDPDSDLRIWRVCGTFPDYAQIYTNTNEAGRGVVVIGRGTQRAAPVTTGNLLVKTNGWRWGAYDGVQRWGENVVAGIVDGNVIVAAGAIGEVLQATFDPNGGSNECHLSVGDSGGALFIKDGLVWKLAGINYGVDGPYNATNTDPGFDAAIFDGDGLYEKNIAELWLPGHGPGSFYATRVSAHLGWINTVLNGPAPTDGTPTLQVSSTAAGQYADEMNSIVDDASKTITVALPGGPRFYRLRACDSLTIKSIQVQNGNLVLKYQ